MSRYLYRGFCIERYQNVTAALTPKAPGKFEHIFCHDGSIKRDGSAMYGSSEKNEVLRHQLNQAGLSTAGVSTSPHHYRAVFYALSGGKNKKGIVITIDRGSLSKYGVHEYVVSATVISPSVPEDEEVILVSLDGGPLPPGIILAEEEIDISQYIETKHFNKNHAYAAAEVAARGKRVGLWTDTNPQAPWDDRKAKRNECE